MHRLSRVALLCALLGIAAVPAAHSALASPARHTPFAADPCSTHLPPNLAFTSGPGVIHWILTGGGALSLSTTKHGFAQSYPGLKVPANDVVEEFNFTPVGSKHHYAGPLNSFVHGATTHVCLNQKLYIDLDETSTGTKHGMTNVRVDGQIVGGRQATLTVWMLGKKYKLTGRPI